jgi:hypothetical protein
LEDGPERQIDLLEEGGATDGGDEAVSIKTLRALTAALGLDTEEVLGRPRDSEPDLGTDNTRHDVALIANIMARVVKPVTHSQLATAMDWDGRRVERAVNALSETLQSVGQTLRLSPEGMTIAPLWDERAQRAAADITTGFVDDDHGALELIWKVWRGGREFLVPNSLSASDQDLARLLVLNHLLDVNVNGHLSISDRIHQALAPAIADQQFYPGEY